MKFKILSEKINPLFSRKEISIEFDSESSPSKEEVIQVISDKLSSKPENITILDIKGKFGTKTFIARVDIYNSPDLKNKYGTFKKRKKKQKKKKAAAKGGKR